MSFLIKKYYQVLIVLVILGIATVAHSYNMFGYPYYENDEGTYMSQAWSIVSLNRLSPYVYWYDHAPGGWILIAIWTTISGGFFKFGFSINSGRILMLILHVASVLILFLIAKKQRGGMVGASIASLIFALSPLGLIFQRTVLLDNIMVFWLLLAYFLILGDKRKTFHYIISAVLFGIAVLSKESAIFFMPVFIYIIFRNTYEEQELSIIKKWIIIILAIISIYLFYALIRGEFFPSGGISFLDTLFYQLSREGVFVYIFKEWVFGGYHVSVADPAIIIGGIAATNYLLFLSKKRKYLLSAVLPGLAYWVFLIRGGYVAGFYVIPLIPFLALNIGLSVPIISSKLLRKKRIVFLRPVLIYILIAPFIITYAKNTIIYWENQTASQLKALEWIEKNIPKKSKLIIDNYAYIEFHDTSTENKLRNLPKQADYYWKVNDDPNIRINVFKNNWRNVDYILSTPQVFWSVKISDLNFIKIVYNHSNILASFNNGREVEILQVDKSPDMINPDFEELDEKQIHKLFYPLWKNKKKQNIRKYFSRI